MTTNRYDMLARDMSRALVGLTMTADGMGYALSDGAERSLDRKRRLVCRAYIEMRAGDPSGVASEIGDDAYSAFVDTFNTEFAQMVQYATHQHSAAGHEAALAASLKAGQAICPSMTLRRSTGPGRADAWCIGRSYRLRQDGVGRETFIDRRHTEIERAAFDAAAEAYLRARVEHALAKIPWHFA